MITPLPVHWRLVALFGWGFVVSALHSPVWLGALLALLLVLLLGQIILARHALRPYLKREFWLNLFGLLILLSLSWQISAEGLRLYPQGIALAQLIWLKMNVMLLSVWLLLFGVSQLDLVQAVRKLPISAKFAQLLVLTVRYIALLGALNQQFERAMRARGFQPQCNRRTLRIYTQRVALLLIHAMLHAEKAEIALKARGFTWDKGWEKSGRKNDDFGG